MIYLDASALFKLVWDEPESSFLRGWLDERLGSPLLCSTLGKVELIRGCRRYDDATISDAYAALDQINLVPMRTSIIEAACQLGEHKLRSLDAVHLASALSVRTEISAFCAYDQRLHAAAAGAGLPAVAPGR